MSYNKKVSVTEAMHDLTGDELSPHSASLLSTTPREFNALPPAVEPTYERVGAGLSREQVIALLLEHLTYDTEREGLAETPKRVAKAWAHWTKGYNENPADVLKVFEDGAENYDEMVMVKDIPLYSHCEHHLAAIIGTATVAYIPNGKVVGLSKLNRVVDIFARRLQVQERLTSQIADALASNLDAKGVGVVITARHMCMESRGICQQGHQTITSALRGVMRDDPATRSEFMALVNK